MLGKLSKCFAWICAPPGAILIFCAEVKPHDAATNIAAWLEWFDVRVPNWALTAHADMVALSVGVTLAIIAILFSLSYFVAKARFGDAQSLQIPVSAPNNPLQNLRALSNAQIKQRTVALAKQLRTFQAGINASSDRLRERQFEETRNAKTDEQRKQKWQFFINQSAQQHQDQNNEFRERFVAEMLALRAEINRRLGIFPPFPVDNAMAESAFNGMLAGPAPAAAAADALENLARQLPDD